MAALGVLSSTPASIKILTIDHKSGSTADRSAQKGSMHLRLLVWPWLAAARLVQRVERQWFEDAGLTWSEDDAPRDASTLPRFEESVDYWPRRAGAEPERVIAIYHGHDASIAVSVGGEVRCVLELERLFGVRFYRPDEARTSRRFATT